MAHVTYKYKQNQDEKKLFLVQVKKRYQKYLNYLEQAAAGCQCTLSDSLRREMRETVMRQWDPLHKYLFTKYHAQFQAVVYDVFAQTESNVTSQMTRFNNEKLKFKKYTECWSSTINMPYYLRP